MILSRACTYGIQAAVYAAVHENEGYVSISKAAAELSIPFHFLTKVLQILTDRGMLLSKRGANGGIMLAKKASEISLLDIVGAIDGHELFEECILGLPGCGQSAPCPLHEHWAGHREDLRQKFESTKLADVVENVKDRSFRISSIEELIH